MVKKEKKDSRISLYSLYNRDMVTISIHRLDTRLITKTKKCKICARGGVGWGHGDDGRNFAGCRTSRVAIDPLCSATHRPVSNPTTWGVSVLWPFAVLYFGQCLRLSSAYIRVISRKILTIHRLTMYCVPLVVRYIFCHGNTYNLPWLDVGDDAIPCYPWIGVTCCAYLQDLVGWSPPLQVWILRGIFG